jgi:hypothetical protein
LTWRRTLPLIGDTLTKTRNIRRARGKFTARSFDKLELAPLFSPRGIHCALTPEADWCYGFRFACQFAG